MSQHVGIYCRVSTRNQDTKSQEPDLERWAAAQDAPAKWYRDTFTGKTMERPGMRKLLADVAAGKVRTIAVWRLDRLGRTARGLTALFDDLQRRGINLVSLREGIDLSTSAGRLMANVLASVAAYETEIRAERVLAGQNKARAEGKRWGGSRKGRKLKTGAKPEQIATVKRMAAEGATKTAMACATGLARPTVYRILRSI